MGCSKIYSGRFAPHNPVTSVSLNGYFLPQTSRRGQRHLRGSPPHHGLSRLPIWHILTSHYLFAAWMHGQCQESILSHPPSMDSHHMLYILFILWYDIRQSLMSEGTAVPPFSRLGPWLLRKHTAWHIWHIPLTQNFHPQPQPQQKRLTGCMLIEREVSVTIWKLRINL